MDDRGRTDPSPTFYFYSFLLLSGGQPTMSTSNIPPIMCSHISVDASWQVACLYHYIYIPLGFGVLSSSASFSLAGRGW